MLTEREFKLVKGLQRSASDEVQNVNLEVNSNQLKMRKKRTHIEDCLRDNVSVLNEIFRN